MLRAIGLSLLVLFSIAVVVPIMDSSAHNDRVHHRKHHHSRAWWRRYHARHRRMRMARLKMRQAQPQTTVAPAKDDQSSNHVSAPGGMFTDPSGRWSVMLPAGWGNHITASNGEVKFRLYSPQGRPAGVAALTPMNIASSKPMVPVRSQHFIGSASIADLRKTVIDKMISSNGWVVNDFERTIDGRPVFVVVAHTAPAYDGSMGAQPWTFYFTEMDGRVYSLATTAPAEFFDLANAGSQQLLASFKPTARAASQTTASR